MKLDGGCCAMISGQEGREVPATREMQCLRCTLSPVLGVEPLRAMVPLTRRQQQPSFGLSSVVSTTELGRSDTAYPVRKLYPLGTTTLFEREHKENTQRNELGERRGGSIFESSSPPLPRHQGAPRVLDVT